MSDASELLAAGAVLPLGTRDAGESAVLLTARTYRHPALDDRVVVRLTAADLGLGEDQASGFLGLERVGEPAEIGFGRRTMLGFPEWVLVHHPEDGHHALAVIPEMKKIDQRAKSKPKAALDAFHALAGRLASSVPHLLPTYYERAARTFLGIENVVYATQMFTHARKAEAEHGLPIDDERHDAVFLEFALAGALPVKALSGYAKELAARVSAEEALRRFTRLCVRRTASGLPPSAQMATELRRMAKAAGESAEAVEHAYLTELLALPATTRAAAGWWKSHRPALIALAGQRPEVRGTLLNMMPTSDDRGFPALWLEILEESGASGELCAPDEAPEEARPGDGSAGWLQRFLRFSRAGWHRDLPPALFPLVERMADRLRTELTAKGEGFEIPGHVDLLDLLLALDVPVADPGDSHRLNLEVWAKSEGRRDLRAVEADGRFRRAFHWGADSLSDSDDGRHALRALIESPGGRPLLVDWVGAVARRSTDTGLPGLPDAMRRLGWLPGEVLVLNEEAVRAAVTLSLAPVLTRTLRAGLFDELHWPAWDEAVAELVPAEKATEILVADAWPYLIVAGPTQARVIGPEGAVLVHDLRIPAGDNRNSVGFRYVDGELLVHWHSSQYGGKTVGYWHTEAGQPRPMEGHLPAAKSMYWYTNDMNVALPLPGGGRTTGAGVVHRGDTVLPQHRSVVTDGTSYWVWKSNEEATGTGWHEYDPVSGECGRESMPGFFADGVREAQGSDFVSGWMLPAPAEGATPVGHAVDGLLGWRVVKLSDGSLRSEDLAGNGVTTRRGVAPSSGLLMPGDDRIRAVLARSYQAELIDQDGVVTAFVKTDAVPGAFAEGTRLLPPARYWHWLRPRDLRGSEALRRIDDETVLSLIKAAVTAGDDDPAEAIGALLPEITHEGLIAGVAGVAKYTAAQQKLLDSAAERLEAALDPDAVSEKEPAGPADELIKKGLESLGYNPNGDSRDRTPGVFGKLQVMARAMADDAADQEELPLLHLDGIGFPASGVNLRALLDGHTHALYRAVTPYNGPEQREALRELLTAFGELGLVTNGRQPVRWRLFELELDKGLLSNPDGSWRDGHWTGLLPLGGGAFLAVLESSRSDDGGKFTTLFHDPAGLFEVPRPYTARSSGPVAIAESAVPQDVFLAEFAERGPAPWFPEAAEEFARLTGATPTLAKLVVAGLPSIDRWERNFLEPEVRALLDVKVADAAFAKDRLRRLKTRFRRDLLGALLPEEPARLWTDGPDVAAAAEVWNAEFGRRVAVPEALLSEAVKAVRTGWDAAEALPALLDPASETRLSRDAKWVVRGDKAVPEQSDVRGFDVTTLLTAVALSAWLAHRLPAGDPLRGRLPAALAAVRARLANPDLMLVAHRYVDLAKFRKMAGAPTETGEGYEQYGAVVMATHDNLPYPAIRTALLGEDGSDPYLAVLRADVPELAALELPWGTALAARFAELLADPGDPVAGERNADGTWWPQDPSRSVPDLVSEVSERYGLSPDAAAVYLMLLAMPDPTDKNTARWTGWKPARIKAARAELAATDLVVEARRSRAGRSLFLPGGWSDLKTPCLPLEEWKLPLYDLASGQARPPLGVVAPLEPVTDLYRRAWQRITEADVPRFAALEVRRGRRR
ncbi:DNA-binding protein [Actinocorallia aurantiaca]|uniref:DNA-binding protein n=1 Tax=Actinocorallia aurantiaca TaxID=46204 RepID=A0ABN3U5M0_9ACTN